MNEQQEIIKRTIENPKHDTDLHIAALICVAYNRKRIDIEDLYKEFGYLRWPFVHDMKEELESRLLISIDSDGEYTCDLNTATIIARYKYFEETERILRAQNYDEDDFIPETTEEKVTQKCDSIKKMLINKNRRYGDSSLNPIGLFKSPRTAKIEARISDKLARIRAMQDDKTSEDYLDAVRDLTGYLILYAIVLDEME